MVKSTFRIKPVAQILAVGILGSALIGCNKASSEIVTPVVTPVKLVEVPDVHAFAQDSFIAKMDATERAALSFQVSGEVEQLHVKMGSIVKKGELLATLDPTDYQLALDARTAEFDLAKTAFERAEHLFAKKLISADLFDQSETQFKAAQASLKQAQTDLKYTKISAPFDGVVSITFAKEHQVVSASQPVLNIIDNHVMDVVFTVPVSYVERNGLNKIENAPLSVTMDSHRNVVIPAQFKEISTQPDQDTNSYTASVTIERPADLNLLPGMTGQVRLQNGDKNQGIRIADSAWLNKTDFAGELFVFDQNTSTISQVRVEFDAQGRVISGLNSGDLVVEAGVDRLVTGQRVKAWEKEGGI